MVHGSHLTIILLIQFSGLRDNAATKVLLLPPSKKLLGGRKDSFNVSNTEVYNLTHADFQKFKENLTYVGYHITVFEDSSNCRLENIGERASVYWIWKTNICTPINPHGEKATLYYKLSENGSLIFDCLDQYCTKCNYHLDSIQSSETCSDQTVSSQINSIPISHPKMKSIQIGKPYIHSWQSTYGNSSIIANTFFTQMFCLYHQRYIEPQLLSKHVNIGKKRKNSSQ